jgi:hypothetical protein
MGLHGHLRSVIIIDLRSRKGMEQKLVSHSHSYRHAGTVPAGHVLPGNEGGLASIVSVWPDPRSTLSGSVRLGHVCHLGAACPARTLFSSHNSQPDSVTFFFFFAQNPGAEYYGARADFPFPRTRRPPPSRHCATMFMLVTLNLGHAGPAPRTHPARPRRREDDGVA